MQIDEEPPDAQPFMRCLHCQADNSRFAETCSVCGARLHSVQQEAYNKTLWAQRRAEKTMEEEALRQMHASGQASAQDPQRQLGEELARQVAQQEEERLFWMNAEQTPGMRLIGFIPSGLRWRLAAGLVAWLALSGYFALTTHSRGWLWAFLGTLIGLSWVFVQPRRYRTRWWWWQGPKF
jgi:hypothetical protein